MTSTKNNLKQTFSVLITGTGLVTFWWSIWGLLDLHFLPANPDIRYLLGIITGLLLLFLSNKKLAPLGN